MDLKEIEAQIHALGGQFQDRLDEGPRKSALAYVDFGECALAIEILCDLLSDGNVRITAAELASLRRLMRLVGGDSSIVDN